MLQRARCNKLGLGLTTQGIVGCSLTHPIMYDFQNPPRSFPHAEALDAAFAHTQSVVCSCGVWHVWRMTRIGAGHKETAHCE
jgi:hypothetical protein